MTKDIFSLIYLINIRPGMFINCEKPPCKRDLNSLYNFIRWYLYWLPDDEETKKIINLEKWYEFLSYIRDKTVWEEKSKIWFSYSCMLFICKNDEEKAWDLFYKLLDEFMEKEWIKI